MGISVNKLDGIAQNAELNSGANGIAKNTESASLFTVEKTAETKEEKESNAVERANYDKVFKAQQKINNSSQFVKYLKDAGDVNKKLRDSSIPYMPALGDFFCNTIKSLYDSFHAGTDKLYSLDLRTAKPGDLDKAINEGVAESKKLVSIATVYMARAQKALQLNKVYTKFVDNGGDPNTINMRKIFEELTKPPETKETSSNKEADKDSKSEKTQKETSLSETKLPSSEEMIKEDKITQITDKLIKYLQKGKKDDDDIDEYINVKVDDKDNKSLADNTNPMQNKNIAQNPVKSIRFFTAPIKIM